MTAKKRRCGELTKKGKPCKGTPISATDFTTCLAHAPEEVRDKLRFGKHQEGSGRPAVPRATDVARRLVEENIVAVQRPYWRVLGYDVVIGENGPEVVEVEGGGAKIYGESKDGDINMTDHDDLGAQMQAADKLQDRSFGRPKQATEVTGADGKPLTVEFPFTELAEWNQKVAGVLQEAGAITAEAASNGNGNGRR